MHRLPAAPRTPTMSASPSQPRQREEHQRTMPGTPGSSHRAGAYTNRLARRSSRCCQGVIVTPAVWGSIQNSSCDRLTPEPALSLTTCPRASISVCAFGFPADAPSMRTGRERLAPPGQAAPAPLSTRQAPRITDRSHSPPRHCSAGHVPLLPPSEDRTQPVSRDTAIS